VTHHPAGGPGFVPGRSKGPAQLVEHAVLRATRFSCLVDDGTELLEALVAVQLRRFERSLATDPTVDLHQLGPLPGQLLLGQAIRLVRALGLGVPALGDLPAEPANLVRPAADGLPQCARVGSRGLAQLLRRWLWQDGYGTPEKTSFAAGTSPFCLSVTMPMTGTSMSRTPSSSGTRSSLPL